MKTIRPHISALRLTALAGLLLITPAYAVVNIDYATVGNAGNAADATAYGAVGYNYKIGKYEVTIGQYAEFLNAVAKTDTHSLYSISMTTNYINGIVQSGSSPNFIYSVTAGSSNKPITFVNWFDAARFCNWMHNGQSTGAQNASTTEDGAYTLNGAVSGVSIAKNAGAKVWIPSENEWYKAAYYDPNKAGGAGYWAYATHSNSIAGNSIGVAASANYYDGDYVGSGSASFPTSNALTDVGVYGLNSASAFGTYDQAGGVWEWNDAAISGSLRGLRGGSWASAASDLPASHRYGDAPSFQDGSVGFRVASTDPVEIDYVTVGNAGNAADATGYGAVNYSYKIGKNEVTNSQYTTFLNAVDPGGVNANGVYSVLMGSDARGGITFTSGSAGGTKYTVRSNMGDKPVFCVSWYDAARFVNWMNNGQGSASPETGAYMLSGNTGIVTRNGVATVWLPSEDEWYKAAHYDPNKGGTGIGGYWLYPTKSDAVPTVATATATGIVSNPGNNVVNYLTGADWNGQDGNLTTVRSTAANNAYGTFDQAGNLWEWNDAIVAGTTRGTRGGSWGDAEGNLKSRNANGPAVEHQYIGFRIASTVGAPVAAITATPNPAAPGQAVSFSASNSASSAPFVSYAWNWGDASAAGSGVTATHSYSHFGSYVVTLTVTDNLTRTASTSSTVHLNQGNLSPVAHPGGSYSIGVGQDLVLNGSGSSDPNASAGDSIVSYQWDVNGDGNYSDASGVSPTVSWLTLHGLGFGIPTTYTLSLRVTDTFGMIGIASTTFQVNARAPSPVFTTAGTVPLTANGFNATSLTVGAMTLGFDPAPGQVLTLVNNTSANPIAGAFTDLPDGGTILTTHGGRNLLFIANYSGGDGNDLILTLLNPEIVVEQPLLTDIADGGSKSFGTVVLGSTASLVFTIKNTGPGILNGLTITKTGANEAEFSVTAAPTAPVNGPAGTTTFTVQFNPATSGAKTAAIHIASDDSDENPFDITLTGQALSASNDTDADGLNDAAEFLLATLGYDWQVSQPTLVNTLMTNANIAGLYTQPQVQALNADTPLLTRNPTTGKFKLTLGLQKSTDLILFDPFPFTAPETSINPQGKLEFEFTGPGNAAFFRLGAE